MPDTNDARSLPKTAQQADEHFRELVAGVEDYAIFLLTPQGHIASWNRGAERIKGFKAAEIVGKHFSTFYPPEAIQRNLPQYELEVATSDGKFVDECWRIRKDGSRFWANVTITTLRAKDGTVHGFLKITRDLTERKQAEENLRQSEERFRLLVEGVRDYAIFMLDPQGHVVSWNDGAERIKGYKAAEIIGRHFSCFYPEEALEQRKPARELEKAIEYGRVEDEGWRVRKDGSLFWANVVITALYDKEGTLRGFGKVTRDLTERRKIEALQEADRQKHEFLAVLAHELRNPLAPILSALHVLGQRDVDPFRAARARSMAERQIRHMGRLLDDLLDLTRISQNRLELHLELVEVQSAINRALEVTQSLFSERKHRVSVTTASRPLWVNADSMRLEQILVNLLTNAAKYTDPGGQIWVTTHEDAQKVTVRVRDSGIGIDAAMLPFIFNLFVQGERQLDRSVGGVGVGLTLVKRLVALHGGTVEAFSPGTGQGSEFAVTLPLGQACRAPEIFTGTPDAQFTRRQGSAY